MVKRVALKNKRISTLMFSKVTSFFDRSKKSKKFVFLGKLKNYDKKSMEWQEDDDDSRSSNFFYKLLPIDSLSWVERNALEKSKSDSSITAIGECNYRTQGVQASLERGEIWRNITSTLHNLDINDEDEEVESDPSLVPVLTKDSSTYSHFNYSYGFKTQDVTTKEIVIQGPEILNFQGNKHSPDEIARYWKKDCRMWLWKSYRFANRQRKL